MSGLVAKSYPTLATPWSVARLLFISYHHILFIHSSIDGHLSCFHVLAVINSCMNIGVHASFPIRIFFRYVPRSEIAGSYGNSIFSFFKKPLFCSP